MFPLSLRKRQKGFSLIELLIVIIIISIVYFLGFSGISKPDSKQADTLNPKTLKSLVEKSELFDGEATLLCNNKCQNCYIRAGIGTDYVPYEGTINLSRTEAYTIDANDNLLKLDEYGRYDDKKICLVVHFYPNGSSTQLIIKQEKKVFFLPAYFGEPQELNSLEEAKELWLKKNRLVENHGDYY